MIENLTRAAAVVACATALSVAASVPAFAGEITGNGTPKPVKGKSLCAYSGLNDGYFGKDPEAPGQFSPDRVQNFGQIVKAVPTRLGGIPGSECNPTKPPSEPPA